MQDMQSKAPHQGWDLIKDALANYKFDEVEVSATHETVSALVVRYDADSGIRRRSGSIVGPRTIIANEERAESSAIARERRDSGGNKAPSQDPKNPILDPMKGNVVIQV